MIEKTNTYKLYGIPYLGSMVVEFLMEEAGIEIVGTPHVYSEGAFGVVMGVWGSVNLMYKIVED